jgi:cytosine/adenosine deaminase-related metal-dependent hydrolase
MTASAVRTLHADGVVTGDGAAIVDGAVTLGEHGEVLDVGRASDVLSRQSGADVVRLRGVVFPGLVNAHVHVELSVLKGRVPGGRGFVAWVDRFVATRTEVMDDEEASAIDRAVDDLDAYATSAVGDVTNRLTAVRPLARRGLAGSVFHEVFGMRIEPLQRRVASLAEDVEKEVGPWPSKDLAYAIAPHTLYTTHPEMVEVLAHLARERGVRTSLHLLEHPAERRALEAGDGPMVDWLAERTKTSKEAFEWPREPPIDFADKLGALGPHVLAVHLTDATAKELAKVAERKAPVVLCPRSNLYIDVRLPPLLAVRAAGIEAALGTDSLASNASLDVLAEARALGDRFPDVPARELVQMATWNGARALGRPDLGRIAKGTRPDIAAVTSEDEVGDPCAFLLAHVKAPRRWIARRHGPPRPPERQGSS